MTPERLQEVRLDRDIAAARIAHDMGNGVDHSLVDLLAAYDALQADYAAAVRALDECEDYFDQRADADCVGDPQQYVGNKEMLMLRVTGSVLSTPRAQAVLKEVE